MSDFEITFKSYTKTKMSWKIVKLVVVKNTSSFHILKWCDVILLCYNTIDIPLKFCIGKTILKNGNMDFILWLYFIFFKKLFSWKETNKQMEFSRRISFNSRSYHSFSLLFLISCMSWGSIGRSIKVKKKRPYNLNVILILSKPFLANLSEPHTWLYLFILD